MNPKKAEHLQLEKKKNMFFLTGLSIALCITLVGFEWRLFDISQDQGFNFGLTEPFEPLTPPVYIIKPSPPAPKRPIDIKIIDDKDIADLIEPINSELGLNEGYPIVDTPEEPIEAFEPEINIKSFADKMPEFPGGLEDMYAYLGENIKYPRFALENEIKGKVFVSFVVWIDGSIRNVKILRGIGGGCDEEAVRVVSKMPLWNPGKQGGKAVPVYFNLPIEFSIKN